MFGAYPNSFNPKTKIKYTIPLNIVREKTKVKIVVFDILGKEITTLVNEYQNTGNYEVEFSAEELTSGVYFYKLLA
ncbi:MAG: T9SS type A sorting domain-containing protein [Ignavibacteriae bacterium]|nr:T9SS type A sorting domain-containing protein [Ignavibacteriota bacterium]